MPDEGEGAHGEGESGTEDALYNQIDTDETEDEEAGDGEPEDEALLLSEEVRRKLEEVNDYVGEVDAELAQRRPQEMRETLNYVPKELREAIREDTRKKIGL